MVAERLAGREKEEAYTITSLAPESAALSEPPLAPQMVLESGNQWVSGIPGFGENALSGFMGEYRVPEETGMIKVWITREFIYYEGWRSRTSVGGQTVREKMGNEGKIISTPLSDNWILTLLFPFGMELKTEDENRIILNFANKLSGFSGQGLNISLPAFIPY